MGSGINGVATVADRGQTVRLKTRQAGRPFLLQCYRLIVLARSCDEEARRLQREGHLSTYVSLQGREAAQIASVLAMRPRDPIFPVDRALGVGVARFDTVGSLGRWLREKGWPGSRNEWTRHAIAPIPSEPGTHLLHAVGWALGARLAGRSSVALAYVEAVDDPTEALRFAGVCRAPVIFVCFNSGPQDQLGASLPVRSAESSGLATARVEGHEPVAVHKATSAAVARARRGGGGTVIEARCPDPLAFPNPADRPQAPALQPDAIGTLTQRLKEQYGTTNEFFDEAAEMSKAAAAELSVHLTTPLHTRASTIFEQVYAAPTPDVLVGWTEVRVGEMAHA